MWRWKWKSVKEIVSVSYSGELRERLRSPNMRLSEEKRREQSSPTDEARDAHPAASAHNNNTQPMHMPMRIRMRMPMSFAYAYT